MRSEYDTVMLSESPLKKNSAAFSSTIDRPSVISRMFSSRPWLKRPISARYSR